MEKKVLKAFCGIAALIKDWPEWERRWNEIRSVEDAGVLLKTGPEVREGITEEKKVRRYLDIAGMDDVSCTSEQREVGKIAYEVLTRRILPFHRQWLGMDLDEWDSLSKEELNLLEEVTDFFANSERKFDSDNDAGKNFIMELYSELRNFSSEEVNSSLHGDKAQPVLRLKEILIKAVVKTSDFPRELVKVS